MTPASVIHEAARAGVCLSLSDDGVNIRATGQRDAMTDWLPIIRQRKADLLQWLAATKPAPSSTRQPTPHRAFILHLMVDGKRLACIDPISKTEVEAIEAQRQRWGSRLEAIHV